MEVKAKAQFIRLSPRKTRLVADVIRGMETEKALDQLKFINKRASQPLAKIINSAISNAANNFELEKTNLFIKKITVNEGPVLKRWTPKARGRATPIRKKTCHIEIVLEELVESGKKEPKKVKIDKPIKLEEKLKEAPVPEKIKRSEKPKEENLTDEHGKKIIDTRNDGHGRHSKIEGGSKKGFTSKIFRRKSG